MRNWCRNGDKGSVLLSAKPHSVGRICHSFASCAPTVLSPKPDIHALIGAFALAALEASVGFSHQTLCEFALARSIAREAGRLSKLVLERQS